jgi:hypothetical protein
VPPRPTFQKCHQATFHKRRPPPRPRFAPFSSRPRPSHRSRAPPPRADVPRSSLEHRPPVIRWDLASATALLPFLGESPSEPFLSQSTALTHLSLSLRHAWCVADRRGPPEATIVVGASLSRSSSSASMSPPRSGELPPPLGRPTHSLCNTKAIGLSPAAPRAPARRQWLRHRARLERGDRSVGVLDVPLSHAHMASPIVG